MIPRDEASPEDEIQFNLTDFLRRAQAVARRKNRSNATISKILFNGDALKLDDLVEKYPPKSGDTLPRLDTMLRALEVLEQEEAALDARGQ